MMDIDKIVVLPGEEEIEAEAARWLTVMGREEVSDSDRADLKMWLNQSSRHTAAFEHLAHLWDDLSALQELDDIAESVASIPTTTSPRTLRPLFSNRNLLNTKPLMSMAASLVVGLVLVGLLSLQYFNGLNQQEIFETTVGEQRTIELSDGSTLQLNTNSRVEVNYSRELRGIRLTQGEAHFDVAKNTRRPFYVYAGEGVVQAVGTAFTVRLRERNEVEVTVEEGRVALASLVPADPTIPEGEAASRLAGLQPVMQQMPEQKLAELTAGQSTVFGQQVEQIAQMQASEISRKLSWRQGMLAYSGDPLLEVVDDVSRYTDVTIEIADPELSAMPVAGYFRAGEVEGLFDALELTFGLQVEHVSDSLVRLSAAR